MFKLNKLALNVDKSVFMLFQHSRKEIVIPQIKTGGNEIKNVEHFNFIGTTINSCSPTYVCVHCAPGA